MLDNLLSAVPIERRDVYITNIVKCRPPNNRDPQPVEVEACAPFLDAQIELINPRVIATLGRHSLVHFFPNAKISRDHGRIMRWRNRILLPLYHPAAALRSSRVMQATASDFERIPEALLAALSPKRTAGRVGESQSSYEPAVEGASDASPETDSGERQQSMF